MKAILHVGMPETGTAAIQATLLNSDLGKIRWFDWMGKQHSPFIAAILRDENHGFVRGKSGEELADIIEKFSRQFEQGVAETGAEAFIVSAERLFGLSLEDLAKVKNFLDKYATSYEVIAYIKEPVSYLSNSFQQAVYTGRIGFTPDRHWPQYRRRITALGQVFGEDNVNLRLYDRTVLKNGDVVEDFFDQIGVELDPDKVVAPAGSLSEAAVALLFVERKFGAGFQGGNRTGAQEEQKLVSRLEALEGPQFVLSSAVLTKVINAHLDEISWLEQRMNTRLQMPIQDGTGLAGDKDLQEAALAAKSQLDDLIEKTVKDYQADTANDIAHFIQTMFMPQPPAKPRAR